MNRRTLTLAAVAGTALAAGLGWQLWRRPAATPPAAPAGLPLEPAAPAPAAAASDSLDLWAQSFERPEGGQIALASLRGKPLIINFWATWCPPCVREMPLLDAYAKRHAAKGLTVLGLAVDGPSPVREYLQKTPVSFPIGLTGFAGTELARQLGNAQGGLPYTVVFDASGAPIRQKLGETKDADLAEWTRALGL